MASNQGRLNLHNGRLHPGGDHVGRVHLLVRGSSPLHRLLPLFHHHVPKHAHFQIREEQVRQEQGGRVGEGRQPGSEGVRDIRLRYVHGGGAQTRLRQGP